ncbi:MAG: lipase maturation factor family protein [Proteobacteria bacterium]|nr:lipase maturation factor family protein [Pseudomonadota bacterium]
MARRKQPLLIYDGDCAFCNYCVDFARIAAGHAVDFQPYQSVQAQFPGISEDEFRAAIQLVLPDGKIVTGAGAAFQTLLFKGSGLWAWCYKYLPLFAWFSEKAYQFVARHRTGCHRISKVLFGSSLQPQELSLTIALFLRMLALIYLAAFLSFAGQALGLIGAEGILPVANYIAAVDQNYGAEKFWLLPTLFWLDSSDLAIQGIAWLGVSVSLLLLFDIFPTLSLCLLYVLYLSLFGGGQVFMSYQWDILLLECGFLAIFLRAWPNLFVWLYRWLLFRFMLQSGLVKLLSGDPSWQQLTALNFHFESQPLPTVLAWYAHKLPEVMLQAGVVFSFVVELLVPFLILMPRYPRLVAGITIALFELMIFLTGSYNFFNLLTLTLCLLLLDDQFLKHWIPAAWLRKSAPSRQNAIPGWRRIVWGSVATIYLLQSGLLLAATGNRSGLSEASRDLLNWSAPFHIANSYGLFAVMTTGRPEIIIEGSTDGIEWRSYELPYKPGTVNRMPVWATPHQPRLDWQLWFAALAPAHRNPWLQGLMAGLLSGSEPVLGLFEKDPFPTEPPKFVRAQLYQYRFSNWQERDETGAWWHRDLDGKFISVTRLRSVAR